MLDLLLALAGAPFAQNTYAAPAVPATAHRGPLTVSEGGINLWSSGGEVTVIVDNSGSAPDRILAMRTPAGTVGDIGVYPVVGARGERAPGNDLRIGPGRTGVLADLTALAQDQVTPTSVTVVFEHAGEVTVKAVPITPVAAPPPGG